MALRWTAASAAALGVAAAAGTTIAGCGDGHPVAERHVTVPITLAGRVGGPDGLAPVVRVRIDGGRPLPVLLDTGSTGLRVLARALPPADRRKAAGSGDTHTWATGTVTTERLLKARLTIGGVRTTHAVNVGVVGSVSCPGATCGRWPSSVPAVVGTLGVSLLPDAATENPLLALAGGRPRRWRITLAGSHPGLELGAPAPAHPAASFAASGTSAAKVCWRFGRRTAFRCLPTVFDTGTSIIAAVNMSGAPSSPRIVEPGTPISAWTSATAHRPFWSLTSGSTSGRNLVAISSTPPALVVSGMPTFRAFAITFDAARGREYLTRLQHDPASRRISRRVRAAGAGRPRRTG